MIHNASRRKLGVIASICLGAMGMFGSPAFAQQFPNPIQAAKDAYNKAKQQQQQKPQAQPQAAPTTNPSSQPQPQGDTPVTAGDLDKPQPEANIVLDPKVMPDMVGVHIGMPLRTAAAALQSAYPNMKITPHAIQMPTIDKPVVNNLSLTTNPNVGGNDVVVGVLLPPNQQIVWSISRSTNVASGTPMNRGTLLASLREKYGKETYNVDSGGRAAASDRDIVDMYWMYNEHGNHIQPPNPSFGLTGETSGCPRGTPDIAPGQSGNPRGFNSWSAWCASTYVAVHAQFSPDSRDPANFITLFKMDAIDVPLAVRAQKATADWYQNIGQRQHQEEIDKSKGVQPKL